MRMPTNTWCEGSGRAAVYRARVRKGVVYSKCPECGYRFRLDTVTPKHRPKFAEEKK